MLRRALDLRIKKPEFLVLILPVLEFGRVSRDQQPGNLKALLSSLDFVLGTGA